MYTLTLKSMASCTEVLGRAKWNMTMITAQTIGGRAVSTRVLIGQLMFGTRSRVERLGDDSECERTYHSTRVMRLSVLDQPVRLFHSW